MALTDKQQRFVGEYLVDLNATQAAIRAGYSASSARTLGYKQLGTPDVADAIAGAMQDRAQRTQITADRVLEELALVGFARMKTYMKATPGGDPYFDFSTLTDEQSAALGEVTVEDYTDRRGDEAREVKRVKFKLHDKLGALDKLGRHLGIYAPDKHEHTGKDGGPIETRELSMDERVRRLAALVAKHEAEDAP